MSEYRSLSHSKWDCKYHLVFIPKKRRKIFFGGIRKEIGEIFQELTELVSLLKINEAKRASDNLSIKVSILFHSLKSDFSFVTFTIRRITIH